MPKAQSRQSTAGKRVPSGNAVPTARVAALRMLARRELSESQIRQRLKRGGYGTLEVDDAVERLKAERAIDDGRVAAAIARTETSMKSRGQRRVQQKIAQAGVAPVVARQAIEATFRDIDLDSLIDAALSRRLRHGRSVADEKEFRRLYRYLTAQGFDSDRVLSTLSKRRRRRGEPEPDD